MGLKPEGNTDKIREGIRKDHTIVAPTLNPDTETIAASPLKAVPAATDAPGPRTPDLVARSAGRTVLTPSQIVNNILTSLVHTTSEQSFY